MQFLDIVSTCAQVAATRSRTTKTELVASALRAAGPDQARLAAHYLAGSLPQRRTGVGWRSLGDLPAPAEHARLTLPDVDAAMQVMAGEAGSGSGARRRAALVQLFAAATAAEQEFLRGLLTAEVRQGALDGVLIAAIGVAANVPDAAVRRAVMLAGWPAAVAETALARGESGLAAIELEVGRPLRPMLAGSAPDVASALDQMGAGTAVSLERKLDGIRLQAHKDGDQVRLFTRSLDEITDRLPDVVAVVAAVPADRIVLDAEAIALRADGRPHPFQITGARTASRTDPTELARTTPVTTFAFDVLHLQGRDLVEQPYRERIAALEELIPASAQVPRLITADPAEAAAFFTEQVTAGHEGVVVKALDAPYAAGRRGAGWVKVKPRHTLDLVVLAVEWGSGRRRGLLSNIHLGARDDDSPTGFVMLGKTFKGMTDEMLTWQTARFLELQTAREGHVVHVRPEQVVEIAVDGLQRSRRYPAGLALRFARVLRYRDDKSADQADDISTVRSLATD